MEPPAQIEVQVQPRASTTRLAGVRDGVLRLRVTAPPVDGKANQAVIELLAEELGVPKSHIEVAKGASGRRKTLRVHGMTQDQVSQWLKELET